MDSLKSIVLSVIPRILGLLDRNPDSKTYGCFDRYYWHYKLIDFPNIRFQEASLILSLIYKNESFGRYFHSINIKSFAEAAICFAFSKQNSDGSFNEMYPFERSFVATSFAGWALTESIMMLNLNGWESNIIKLGDWLSENDNIDVSNQMAGAANALYNISFLTKDKKYLEASNNKINKLFEQKENELFLSEYGGADIGYLSIALSHLANLWKKTKCDLVLKISDDAGTFIDNNLNEDGRFDWDKMSRKTQYVYPNGFAILKRHSVLNKLSKGLSQNLILNPLWMDDRFCIPFTLDYLMAFQELYGDKSKQE